MRCPSCDFENPEGMNFCGKCATPLSPRCPECGFENPAGFAFCGRPSTGSGRTGKASQGKETPFMLSPSTLRLRSGQASLRTGLSKHERIAEQWIKLIRNPYHSFFHRGASNLQSASAWPFRWPGNPRVLLVAGEASGDAHGGDLVAALKRQAPDTEVFGVGGQHLRDAGMHTLVDTAAIAGMGLFEA